MVIRTRSVQYMPFLLSLFNFLNGLIWTLYSIVTQDIFIAVTSSTFSFTFSNKSFYQIGYICT